MTKEEIEEIIMKHQIWLAKKVGGERADFRNANLIHANLTEVNLAYANLTYADLTHVNLTHANLIHANLTHANLTYANLTHAHLVNANLTHVNLTYADLYRADLAEANLTRTHLPGANLTGIKTNYLTIGIHSAPEGELIGWGKKNQKIVKMLIPAKARRSCATTRKHRAEFAEVLWIEDGLPQIIENKYGTVIYEVGKTVRCHEWEEDRWKECVGDIHFFLTREEAESWRS